MFMMIPSDESSPSWSSHPEPSGLPTQGISNSETETSCFLCLNFCPYNVRITIIVVFCQYILVFCYATIENRYAPLGIQPYWPLAPKRQGAEGGNRTLDRTRSPLCRTLEVTELWESTVRSWWSPRDGLSWNLPLAHICDICGLRTGV
jgi:hypothetical protein